MAASFGAGAAGGVVTLVATAVASGSRMDGTALWPAADVPAATEAFGVLPVVAGARPDAADRAGGGAISPESA